MKTIRSSLIATLLLAASSLHASTWQSVPSPNVGTRLNQLSGVSAAGDSDVWAVGANIDPQTLRWVPLIEHWDGTSWSVVPTPALPEGTNLLNGVAVAASNDVWAVGQLFIGSLGSSLIEHWDGTSWSVVASPNVPRVSNYLRSVTIVSPDDIWAVGYTVGNGTTPLTMHWDGSSWRIVATPAVDDQLSATVAIASNDVWAFGVGVREKHAAAMHWDGAQWNAVAAPPGTYGSSLNCAAAISSTDLWAGGENGVTATLTDHWNGAEFDSVASPTFQYPLNNADLLGLVALATNDAYGVGEVLDDAEDRALVEHWNGTSWRVIEAPALRRPNSALAAITATPDGTLWAVGSSAASSKAAQTFIVRRER
jgi:hypothetical protein